MEIINAGCHYEIITNDGSAHLITASEVRLYYGKYFIVGTNDINHEEIKINLSYIAVIKEINTNYVEF